MLWSDIAERFGRLVHPAMQWKSISQSARGESWDGPGEPAVGSLPTEPARRLAQILANHTRTPNDCFYGLWEGWSGAPLESKVPRFEIPNRTMGLFQGSIEDAAESFEPWPADRHANLWWPRDLAWFVVSEIDYDSTIVAASRECIGDVVRARGLEAFEVLPSTDLSNLGDQVNT